MTRLRNWHKHADTPADVGRIVWVWVNITAVLAVWDGTRWRTLEGQCIPDVTHWHEQ